MTDPLLLEYFPILIFLGLAIVIAVLAVGASYVLGPQNPDVEKISAYECGFEAFEDARGKFDVRFYLVAILFIIFDIETMFLMPWSISVSHLNFLGFWSMIDFVIELGAGFVYIWYCGALDWS